MLLIIGTVRLPPDRLDQAKPAMQRMISASRAEPGCLGYSYAQDVLDAGLIHVSEAWSDRAALETHFKSAHIAEWRASWAELGIGERKLTLFETDGGAPT
ncbi:antibiotic biosynthesis monooxygenase [Mesorhizobium sp. ESP-6-4]|uniref:putative quinol monooxygenase n=1 Tax=Mesorhizobium sp. ESP-6-4 TaxID=2876624 RepID=UPI001CCD7CCB|nr:putative quinol monooxygenase [Mesorhizobium sp. ESP-6-4]MBZ9660219.1 antibiotic biosynthesis monooxygenase [Mesorhizobium sp. ESP-6-4]